MTATGATAGALDGLDLRRVDPEGMLATVESSPAQWAQAVAGVDQLPLPETDASRIRCVVTAGMGGSGIAGNVAAVAAASFGGVPVVPHKSYELPAFVGPDVLVVTISYSGGTSETLSCYDAAGERGAPRYVITSGGELERRAQADGVPVARVPGGGQPRANLPNLAVPLLGMLDRAGLVAAGQAVPALDPIETQLEAILEPMVWNRPVADNPVKSLALALHGHVPVFVGGHGWPALAAMRAKCQVNENAKAPAFWNELPELAHNEIVGWGVSQDTDAPFALVDLRSRADEAPGVDAAFAAIREIARRGVTRHTRIEVAGPNPLVRFAAAVLRVDLLSVYLALIAGRDPTPVGPIDELKARTG